MRIKDISWSWADGTSRVSYRERSYLGVDNDLAGKFSENQANHS